MLARPQRPVTDRARRVVVACAAAVALVATGCSSPDGAEPEPGAGPVDHVVEASSSVVSRVAAEQATSLAVDDDGALLVGERLSGRVLSVDPDSGEAEELLTIERLGVGEDQGGLLDLAVDAEGTLVASYTDSDSHIVIDEIDWADQRNGPKGRFTRRWDGPHSTERSNGGRLAVLGGDTDLQDTLVIGIGDLLDPDASADPDTANGKLLAIDDAGDAKPFAAGLNNPYALGSDGVNTVWVADNAPGDEPERLLRITAARTEKVASWSDRRVPAGLAVLDDGALAICYYATGDLMLVDPDNPKHGTGPRLANDCRYGVQAMGDGRLAYSTEDEVVVLDLAR